MDKQTKLSRPFEWAAQDSEIRLAASDDSGGPRTATVQVLRAGTFNHSFLGKLKITPKMLGQFVETFEGGVVGSDIALDIEHKREQGAMGWFRRVFLSDDGNEMWGDVELTPPGVEQIETKVRKYVSIWYDLAFVDSESGELHGPTMLGAALTAWPFVKRMAETTLNFSEVQATAPQDDAGDGELIGSGDSTLSEKQGKENDMAEGLTDGQEVQLSAYEAQLSDLRATLGLPDEGDPVEAVKAMLTEKAEAEAKAETVETVEEAKLTAEERASDLEAKLTAALTAGEETTARLTALEDERKGERRDVLLSDALRSGKLFPHEAEAGSIMHDLAFGDPVRFTAEMGKREAKIEFGERGTSEADDAVVDPGTKLADKADERWFEMRKSDPNADYELAMKQIERENPALVAEYRDSRV